jgi:hypothetical protein
LENERFVVVETYDPDMEALVESSVREYARDIGAVYIDDLREGQAVIGNSVRYPHKEYVLLIRRWHIHGSRKILVSFQDLFQDTSISGLFINLKVVLYGSNEPMKNYRLKQRLFGGGPLEAMHCSVECLELGGIGVDVPWIFYVYFIYTWH